MRKLMILQMKTLTLEHRYTLITLAVLIVTGMVADLIVECVYSEPKD